MNHLVQPGGNLEQVCTQYNSGLGFQEGARQYTEITFLLFALNLGLIFTGRFLVRENPYQINILGKTFYEFEHRFSQQIIKRIDRVLFTISFTLISILTVLQTTPFGQLQQG